MTRLGQASPEQLMASMVGAAADGGEASCFEQMAQLAMEKLHGAFPESIVLARMYLTVPFAALPEKNAGWVRDLAEAKGVSAELGDETQVISLVGTAGRQPAWNDRSASRGHVGR